MGKFARSWSLMKSSAHILRQDKEMLIFPALSGITSLLLMASFIGPVLGQGFGEGITPEEVDQLYYQWIFVFYILSYFIVVFYNTAVISCAMIRMDGGDPTVSDGLVAAVERLPQIAAWSLFAGTVGFVMRVIEERSAIGGRIVIALLGIAWTITAYLAVPALVAQKLGPIAAFRESASLLRKTWGEQLIGGAGFGAALFLFGILGFIPAVVGFFSGSENGMIVGIVVSVMYFLLLGVTVSALQVIYQTAIYRYAVSGDVPAGFDRDALVNSIEVKS